MLDTTQASLPTLNLNLGRAAPVLHGARRAGRPRVCLEFGADVGRII